MKGGVLGRANPRREETQGGGLKITRPQGLQFKKEKKSSRYSCLEGTTRHTSRKFIPVWRRSERREKESWTFGRKRPN